MMARITPVSLHFSDVPTGWKKNFTDKQQLATGFACSSRTVSPDKHTGFACSSRTVSPDEQCYRLICASCTQCHSVRKPSSSHKLRPSKGRYHDAADVACLPLLLLQQSGYCGRSLSGHLHGHDLSSSISVNAERSSSQSAGCSYSRFTTQSLQCPQM